jgi:hypothetical protein
MAPRVLEHPGTRPTERMPTVDTTKSSVTTHPPKLTEEERLARLEERYRHELLDDQELRDQVLVLRRRLGR